VKRSILPAWTLREIDEPVRGHALLFEEAIQIWAPFADGPRDRAEAAAIYSEAWHAACLHVRLRIAAQAPSRRISRSA
jgi:hypothetical protein